MPKLDCSVSNCEYYKNEKCCLDNIKVEGSTAQIADNTACGSFKNKGCDCYTNSVNSCGCTTTTDTAEIDCSASKCKFNNNMRCTASDIKVIGNNAQTYNDTMCQSFQGKV